MKKIIQIVLIIFIISFSCTAQNYIDEGTFISVGKLDKIVLKINNSHFYKCIDGNTLTLLYKIGNYDFGSFSIDGLAPGFIVEKKFNDNLLILKCILDFPDSENQNSDKQFLDYNILNIRIVDNDEIIMNDLIFYTDEKSSHYYRISGPAKIPLKNARINDSNVRLRVKPNLSCDTWAKLQKGTTVKIKDKSSEPFEIDGESWYWYKVDNPNYPDGWVYGKYLDIEN